MWDSLPLFKKIEIVTKTCKTIYYTNASLLITGDYLVVIKKEFTEDGDLNHTQHDIINLSEIKLYKTK